MKILEFLKIGLVEMDMPTNEWDSYPGFAEPDGDEDVDCLGPDRPDDQDEDD